MNINLTNYFSVNNRLLTGSKIKAFLQNKEYFYKRFISGEVIQKTTPSLTMGTLVDDLVGILDGVSTNKFVCVSRRNMKNPPKGYIELNKTMYEEAINISDAVIKTDAYKELISKKYIRQGILTYDMKLGEHFDALGGMLDFYLVEGDKGTIVDLKTTTSINPKDYYYTCLRYRYFEQLAIYRLLLKVNFPNVKTVKCYHLSVEKSQDMYNTEVFEIDSERLDMVTNYLVDDILPAIASEKGFKAHNPSLSTGVLLGAINEGEGF
jgi:hypothetical protein